MRQAPATIMSRKTGRKPVFGPSTDECYYFGLSAKIFRFRWAFSEIRHYVTALGTASGDISLFAPSGNGNDSSETR
jgi:hypothetical protein